MTILDRYLLKEYGAKHTTMNEDPLDETSIGTSAVMVLRHNPNRIMWFAMNLSSNTIHLGFNGQILVGRGILLDPSGGQAKSHLKDDLYLTSKEVWAIADAATSTFYIFEVVEI